MMKMSMIIGLMVLTGQLAADDFLPRALVLKPTSGTYFPSDPDFHIALPESNTAVIWVAHGEGFQCGAVCSSAQDGCEYKMISKWAASPHKGDIAPISSIPHREIDWELLSDQKTEEKWAIAGVHKKQNVPVNYLIKKGDETVWISKQQALELSLEGKLEIVIPHLAN